MKQIIFSIPIVYVMLLAFGLNAASPETYSKDTADVINKAGTLTKLFYATHKTDTSIAFGAIQELQLLVPKISDSLTKAMVYRCQGDYFEQKSRIENAISFYEKSLSALDGLDSREAEVERAKTLANKGIIFQKFGEIETALSLFLEAEQLFVKNNYFGPLINVYAKMGDIYLRNGDIEKNAAIIGKSTSIIKHIDDPEILANYYINMGNVYGYSARMDSAFLFLGKAKDILEKSQNHYQLGTLYYNMGFFSNQQGNLSLAEENYRKSLAEYQKTGIGYDICDATLRIGGCLYYQEKYKEAEVVLLEALEMAEEQKSLLLIRNCYDVLSCLEYDRKNYQQAYEYIDEYVSAHTKLTSENVQNQMNFLSLKYETEKKESTISELQEKTKLQRILLVITGILLLFLIGLILLSYRYLQQKAAISKQHSVQLEQERKLQATQAVLDGETAERSRMARDLHDGLGSMLSVVKLNLQGVKSYAVLEEEDILHFNRAIEMLNDSIGELSRVARNMMPESLMRYGLKASLTDFCNTIPTVKLHFFGNDKRIDSKLEILIYRSVHELVNNALKHAEASQINVQLVQESDRISLTVHDNGKGFDLSAQRKGMGITNIKNRVATYNGEMNIYSAPGKGTEANIEFPL
ncbi:sensor histidine kinase [Draconibacterium sp.]